MFTRKCLALILTLLFSTSATADPFGTGFITAFNAGGGVGTLSLDGNNAAYTAGPATCGCTVTLTTTHTNDWVYVSVYTQSTAVSTPHVTGVTDAAGLSWARVGVANNNGSGTFNDVEIWAAKSTGILTSDTITVASSTTVSNTLLIPFGVNGANLTSPLDPNVSIPSYANTNTGTGTTLTNTISTTKAATMLITTLGSSTASLGTLTRPSGFTAIFNAGNYDAAYKIVSSAQSSIAESYSWTNAGSAAYTIIAIQASGQ
jgi:hypothetical protein